MRMFDLLTSGVIFVGRWGWGVVAMLGLSFGVILALGGSWARWVYLLFLLFPALEDARTGYVSDGWPLVLSVCGALLMLSRGGVSPLSFDGRRNGGALWTAVSDL